MQNATPSEKDIQKSLTVSWKEGIPAAVMLGIMDNFLIPYGLFLGATTQMIGFLASLPDLVASIAQLFAVNMVGFAGSRLRFLVWGARLQAMLLIPIALLALCLFPDRIYILIILIMVFKMLGSWIATAWGSLVSDYLPADQRGRYLGWRSRVVGIAGLVGIVLAGFLLFSMKTISSAVAFFLLFAAASANRFISSSLMTRMVDLPVHAAPGRQFTFIAFLRRFRESNFVKYVLFIAGITFTTQMAAPYFSVFMLRDLHFNYLTYTAMLFSAIVAGLIGFPIWGRHADLAGNASILRITGLLIPVIPLLWLISRHPLYIFVIQAFSGFVWSGFNLCATNFIYDAVTPAKRVRCLGYFNLINGCAIFAGAALGGFLGDRLPLLGGFSLTTLFLLSSLLRFLAYFTLSPKFQEVRESAKKVSSTDLFFSVLGIRSITGLNAEENIASSSVNEPS